jgi:hypothetical protein
MCGRSMDGVSAYAAGCPWRKLLSLVPGGSTLSAVRFGRRKKREIYIYLPFCSFVCFLPLACSPEGSVAIDKFSVD